MYRHIAIAVSVAVIGIAASHPQAEARTFCPPIQECLADCPLNPRQECRSLAPNCDVDEDATQCLLDYGPTCGTLEVPAGFLDCEYINIQ